MNKEEKFLNIEEQFHAYEHKLSRKERKRISHKDRSRFKKTDIDKQKKIPFEESDALRGRVLAVVPEGIVVASEEIQYLCSLKGALKQDKNQMKNLVAVGDFVRFEKLGEKCGCIIHVEPRISILSRADNLSRNKQQLIAVNIDQVLITVSVAFPSLKPSLIDRYIIAALKGNMQPIIVINKIDLLSSHPEEQGFFEQFLAIYQQLGFCMIPVSIKTGEGIGLLKSLMQGKTSVFSGQSGVGKSSLINLTTGSQLLTGDVVQKTAKGSHTTTTATLVPLKEGGFCIDTPGIKSFGLWNLKTTEIASYFSEIAALQSQCKYPNCAHLEEPECAVKDAVENQTISPLRFASYSALMASVSAKHTQR